MSSKKIADCVIHGVRLPSVCTAQRIRHAEILYEPHSSSKYETKNVCHENEYMHIPPVPRYQSKWNVCNPPKKACRTDCICPPKPCRIPFSRRLRNMLFTIIKAGIFVSIINLTNEFHIWSTADEIELLYQTAHEAIFSNKDENIKPELPGIERITYNIAKKWNDTIVYTGSYLFGTHPSTPKENS